MYMYTLKLHFVFEVTNYYTRVYLHFQIRYMPEGASQQCYKNTDFLSCQWLLYNFHFTCSYYVYCRQSTVALLHSTWHYYTVAVFHGGTTNSGSTPRWQ